jgi:hypothetical protein
LAFWCFHGGIEACTVHIHAQAALAAHIGREIEREAVGIVQLEGHIARQDLGCRLLARLSRISMPVASVSKKRSSSTRSTSVMRAS